MSSSSPHFDLLEAGTANRKRKGRESRTSKSSKKQKKREKSKKEKKKSKKIRKEKKVKKEQQSSIEEITITASDTSSVHGSLEVENAGVKKPSLTSGTALALTTTTCSYSAQVPRPLVESSAVSPQQTEGNDRDSSVSLVLFYQYVEPPWNGPVYREALRMVETIAKELGVKGRMRVAKEGLNCTLSSSNGPDALRRFCSALREWMPNVFCGTEFKITNDLPLSNHFSDLKVMPVSELVHYGLDGDKAPPIQKFSGTHLEPEEYHKKLAEPDTVVIDVRNHYEAKIGHFNAPNSQFIDPNMRKSTEFPVWLDQQQTKEQLRGKQVLMYCTGGIRCERASALLKYKIANDPTVHDLGIKGVYQLQGGVDKYFKQFPEGGYWQGKNYTFDKRYAHTPAGKSEPTDPLSTCEACQKPWDRFGGKRRCPTCGVPSLLCNDCYKSKTHGENLSIDSVRCDLCVKQDIHSKASLRAKEERELEAYERRQKELGLNAPAAEGYPHESKASNQHPRKEFHEDEPNPDCITRLHLKNMCKDQMTEEILMAHLPGITHIVWRTRQGHFFGQGWVEMDSPESAAKAVARSGEMLLNRPLYIVYQAPDPKDLWPPLRSAV